MFGSLQLLSLFVCPSTVALSLSLHCHSFSVPLPGNAPRGGRNQIMKGLTVDVCSLPPLCILVHSFFLLFTCPLFLLHISISLSLFLSLSLTLSLFLSAALIRALLFSMLDRHSCSACGSSDPLVIWPEARCASIYRRC